MPLTYENAVNDLANKNNLLQRTLQDCFKMEG